MAAGPISFQCYSCHQVLKVGADKAGKRGKCPKCGTSLTVPISSTVDTAPAPAAPTPPPATRKPPPAPRTPPPLPAQPVVYQAEVVDTEPMRAELVDEEPAAPMQAELVGDGIIADLPARGGYGTRDAEAYAAPPRGGLAGLARARLGLLLTFVGFCVIAGAFVLQFVGYILVTINVIQAMSATYQGSKVFLILFRIAEPFAILGSLTAIAGYVLCMLGPRRNGALALSITTLALATLHLLLVLIFKLVFLYGSSGGMFSPTVTVVGFRQEGMDVLAVGTFGRVSGPFGESSGQFGNWFVLLLAQIFFGAELILFPLYLRALCKLRGKRWLAGSCFMSLLLASLYTSFRLIVWIMWYICVARTGQSGKGLTWTTIVLLWIGTGLFVGFIIQYILKLWAVRSAVK